MSVEPNTTEINQWYVDYPELYQQEIDAMKTVCSEAAHGFLDTGQMYWKVPCVPIIHGKRKEWVLLLLYDSDYPYHGQSVRCYPTKPNYDEIRRIMFESDVNPKIVPHCTRDTNGMIYFSTERVGDNRVVRQQLQS